MLRAFPLAAALVLLASAAHAQDRVVRFLGYAYDAGTGRYLYTELHERNYTGENWLHGETRYFAPDGTPIGRKAISFAEDRFLPVYRLEVPAEGYVEGITSAGNPIAMIRQFPGGALETGTVKRDGETATDAGFPPLLVSHFDELMRGDTVHFRIAVASRFDSFRFRAHRVEDTTLEGKAAVCFEAEVDSILKLFTTPLRFTFDPATKRLLEYRGISNLHDPAMHKPYDVRISYAATPPKDAGKLPPLPSP